MAKADRDERLDVGRVYADSLALIWRNGIMLILLAAVLYWAPRQAFDWLHLPRLRAGHPDAVGLFSELARTLLDSILDDLLVICVVWLMLSSPGRFFASFGGMARAVLPRLPLLIPFTILVNSPSFLGVFLRLAAPAISTVDLTLALTSLALTTVPLVLDIWLLAWIGVVDAVFIQENLSIIRTISRAAKLLDGQRWRYMSIMIPILVVVAIAAVIVGERLKGYGLTQPIEALMNATTAVVTAVCYRELRRIKDGQQPDHVAAIFD